MHENLAHSFKRFLSLIADIKSTIICERLQRFASSYLRSGFLAVNIFLDIEQYRIISFIMSTVFPSHKNLTIRSRTSLSQFVTRTYIIFFTYTFRHSHVFIFLLLFVYVRPDDVYVLMTCTIRNVYMYVLNIRVHVYSNILPIANISIIEIVFNFDILIFIPMLFIPIVFTNNYQSTLTKIF